jgi:uncharacterized protein YacL
MLSFGHRVLLLPMILAAISASTLLWAIVGIIVAGLIYFLLNYAIDASGIPEPFRRVAKVVLILIAVLFLINALLSLMGHPLIRWP